MVCVFFFFQAEDGIRDLVRSRGLGDVYKRQRRECWLLHAASASAVMATINTLLMGAPLLAQPCPLSLIHI